MIIQDDHIYLARNGSVHQVLTTDADPTIIGEFKPVITKVLSDPGKPGETLRSFTEEGRAVYTFPGKPVVDHPSDLVKDITDGETLDEIAAAPAEKALTFSVVLKLLWTWLVSFFK